MTPVCGCCGQAAAGLCEACGAPVASYDRCACRCPDPVRPGAVVVGVDPGSADGGIAVRRRGALAFLGAYSTLRRKSGAVVRARCVKASGGALEHESPTLAGAVAWLAWEADVSDAGTVCVEGLYVPRKRTRRGRSRNVSPQSVIPLAESAGGWLFALAALTERDALELRPEASVWRRSQLGIRGRVDADAAEAYAVRMAAPLELGASTVGELIADWTKVERGAASEAVFIARHGETMATDRARRGVR